MQSWQQDGEPWNPWLSASLYELAMKHATMPWPPGPPLSRWTRFRYRLDAWLPRIHLGPCDHSECD